MKYIFYYLLVINLLTIILYGIDKIKAISHKYRISEFTLIFLGIMGGSIGAMCAMLMFRHKTAKVLFNIGIPVMFFIQLISTIYLIYLKGGLF